MSLFMGGEAIAIFRDTFERATEKQNPVLYCLVGSLKRLDGVSSINSDETVRLSSE